MTEATLPKYARIETDPVLFFDNQSGGSNLEELLTISDVAALFKISTMGVRRIQQKRQIPFHKVGGSIRFRKTDLIAYLQKVRVEAID